VLVFIAGTIGSIFFAGGVARSDAQKSQRTFGTSAIGIANTLKFEIQHEDDLVLASRAFVVGNPNASEAKFTQWARTLGALQRYPELQGFGESRVITAAELPAFAAHPVIEAAGESESPTPFKVIPPGNRPFYCFTVIGLSRNLNESLPPGFDLCAGSEGRTLLASRESGNESLEPLTVRRVTTLSLVVPTYRGGLVPTTVPARLATFIGWVGMSLVPSVILDTALSAHSNTAVALRYGAAGSTVVFRSGPAFKVGHVASINLQNGWTVLVFERPRNNGIFGDSGHPLILMVGGIGLSLLLSSLILLLGTGRRRLMLLVDERTDQLRFQALHDSLTDLPNRALIIDRIDQLLVRSYRNGTTGAALFVDIDDFKNVNDSLGHAAGDQLLVSVAARLASTLRGADTIGRMGGDEFVVLIDGGAASAAPELVAQRLLDVMAQPFELHESLTPLVVNVSIGIALGNHVTGGELLRDADIALYQAKAGGKNRYELFHPEMQSERGRRMGLEFELRSALAGDQFHLVYQPIYNLEDLALAGVEALLRWESPAEGPIAPDEFVPILEQTGLIREVGAWVLRQACEQMAHWHALGDTMSVSVNVSGRQLDDDSIIEHIRDALHLSGLDAASLVIEVTETALMRDVNSAVRCLEAIKELGVGIAVDDFGTGYCSLGYLRQFPVDCIKIDRSFTNAISSSSESKALVRTFVQLGKDLGLKTLAEGLETPEQMDLLRSDHVDEVQGFLLSHPLDPESLESQILNPMRAATPTRLVE
jgi:diguanylate cyclase (GGDEF)-like protein